MKLTLEEASEAMEFLRSVPYNDAAAFWLKRIAGIAHRNLEWHYHSPGGLDSDPHFYSEVISNACYAFLEISQEKNENGEYYAQDKWPSFLTWIT